MCTPHLLYRLRDQPKSHSSTRRIPAENAVAYTDDRFGQAEPMRRRPARLPAPRSGFAGFRFPPEAITVVH
jgi:hypothetical protein